MAYNDLPSLGQSNKAGSLPVTIASDQDTLPVSVSGVSTAANQDTIIAAVDGIETLIGTTNTTLTTIDGRVDGLEASNSAIQTAVEKLDNVVQTEGSVYVQGDAAIIAGVRKDASGSPSGVADGDVHPMVFNQEGRLKVSAQPAIYTASTGTITASAQTINVDVSRASNVMFYVTGTFSTVNCTFEGSIDGGTSWFTVQAIRSNANTIETTTGNLSAAPIYAWEASVNALTNFRLRSTAWASGTQNWTILPGAYATEPIPGAQVTATQPVSLTSTTITSVIPTTAATALGKARDSAIGSTDTGVAILGVRRDAPTAETPVAGDYVVPQVSANGEQWVAFVARTTGGYTPGKLVSAATTNATSIKASAGTLGFLTASNINAAARYVKFYNKASAPTVGTDVPVATFIIPGNTAGAGTNIPIPPQGLNFSTGIAMAITTEATDAGTTAVAASEIVINYGTI